MPTLSEFDGVKIQMFFQEAEHNFPHFHAWYNGSRASFSIETGELLAGKLPDSIVSQIQKWYNVHKEELVKAWESQSFIKIPPTFK